MRPVLRYMQYFKERDCLYRINIDLISLKSAGNSPLRDVFEAEKTEEL